MRLELGSILVKDVQFSSHSEFRQGTVYINQRELLAELWDDRLASIDVDIVKPGEPVRLCPVKDVLEPRVKVAGPGQVFPDILAM